jgi:uncharacterized protein (DUF1330 family)
VKGVLSAVPFLSLLSTAPAPLPEEFSLKRSVANIDPKSFLKRHQSESMQLTNSAISSRNESFAEPGKLKRRTMPAYLISLCRHVTDRKRLEDYWANVAPAFKGFDAKPLVAYKPFEVLEGDGGVRGVVLFEFPSMEEARHWYTSAAYQEVKKRREGAANFDLILVEGGFVPAAERMPESKS